jgi:hypothetical protein
MHSAILWLSFAIGLTGRRDARPEPTAAPLARLRAMPAPPSAQHLAQRSGWTRAMEELALVPVRPRSPGRRGAPVR